MDQLHVGDFGKDLDDEVAALISASMVRSGLVTLRGTIGNLDPAVMRARLAKGTYQSLGLDVPVAVGTPCDWAEPSPEPHQFSVPYLAGEDTLVHDGLDLFDAVTSTIPDKGLHLVLMSGFTDAARLLEERREVFLAKVGTVTLMSGVEVDGEDLRLEDGFLIPNHTSNNDFDYPAAVRLYQGLQVEGVPMRILTRNAARAASVPRHFYDDLAMTGHPVGLRLAAAQRGSMTTLWEQCCMERDDPRRTLPWGPEDDPRTKEWFAKAFCNGQMPGEDVWSVVSHFGQYDSLTVLASHPETCDLLFEPEEVEVRGVTHQVIGSTSARHGVKNPAALVGHLSERSLHAVRSSL